MGDPLEIPAALLRAALAAQDFRQANELLRAYCQQVERRLGKLSPEDPEAQRISAETCELFGWIRSTTLSLRAQICLQLESLHSLSPYLPPPSARHTWNLEG